MVLTVTPPQPLCQRNLPDAATTTGDNCIYDVIRSRRVYNIDYASLLP